MQQSMNVRRTAGVLVIGALASLSVAAAEIPGTFRKYLQPAAITKLDWLLLRAQVESFSGDIRWDQHNLVRSVSLYSTERALVGMTFVVNKERYIALSDEVARKTFADVVSGASNILEATIPEVKNAANVYASFVAVGTGVIAEYTDGKVILVK